MPKCLSESKYFDLQIENIPEYFGFFSGVAIANCLTGLGSLFSPILLIGINMYFPYTDLKTQQFESSEQQ